MGARLYSTEKLVEEMLYQYPDTRDSDALLYLIVCKAVRPESAKLPLEKVLLERKTLGLPSFKSVERNRRMLQRLNPELRGNKEIEEARADKEDEYRAYALGGE